MSDYPVTHFAVTDTHSLNVPHMYRLPYRTIMLNIHARNEEHFYESSLYLAQVFELELGVKLVERLRHRPRLLEKERQLAEDLTLDVIFS
jgi:hypothetical protein